MQTLRLTPHQLQGIQRHAEQTYPQECCGLLLGNNTDRTQICAEVWPTQNMWSATNELIDTQQNHDQSHSRHDRFWIDPGEILNAQRYGRDRNLDIIGIYHSHPDHPAKPSEHDRQYAWTQYSYFILSVHNGRVTAYQAWILNKQHQFQSQVILIA